MNERLSAQPNGLVDPSVHYIALRLCADLDLDYPTLYEKAYQDEEIEGQSWLRSFDWKPIEEEIDVPEVSEWALRKLLWHLGEINNGSVIPVLKEEFTRLGYNMEGWWEDRLRV